MKYVESSRDPERYIMVWPGVPSCLTKDQARNWFLQHKKPRGYVLERLNYNPKNGWLQTIGYDTCR